MTQMSLLGDDDDNNDIDSSVCPTPSSKPQKKEKISTKHRREAKDSHRNTTRETSRPSPYHPLRSDSSNNELLIEQLLKWKNDYMRGLSMYIEDQLKQFDRSNSMVWNTLSNEGIHKKEKRTLISSAKQSRLADPVRKPCHTCDKKPVNMMKLRSIWNRPGTASKRGKVLPRLLVSSDKTPPLGSELNKTHLRKEVRQRLKTLRLGRNSIPILAANDIKLVCHAGQLIMVGEGSTSISILGHLLSEKTFVVLKMFKLPYAGGKTIEITRPVGVSGSCQQNRCDSEILRPRCTGSCGVYRSRGSRSCNGLQVHRTHPFLCGYHFVQPLRKSRYFTNVQRSGRRHRDQQVKRCYHHEGDCNCDEQSSLCKCCDARTGCMQGNTISFCYELQSCNLHSLT